MTTLALAAVTFVVAMAVAALLIPGIIRLATRWQLLDFPNEARRIHSRAVPRLGGVAVFAGLLAALAWMVAANRAGIERVPPLTPMVPALLAACAILFVIGLLDDLRGVRPSVKLAAQSVAALIVIRAGFGIDLVSLGPGNVVSLGALGTVVSLVWLVGISNSFNLVDGLDGLAGTVAVVALAMFAVAAVALGTERVAYHSAALAGALVGFLLFNASPARIFLGDSGSLVVGFLLALIAVEAATGPDGALHILVPIFSLAYLLLDTGLAIARRWLRGEPLSRADGRHVHHQLRSLGLTTGRAVMVLGAASLGVGVLGLAATFMPPRATLAMATLAVLTVVLMVVHCVRWLEYHELLEAGASVASAARKARSAIQDRIRARDLAATIAKADSVEEIQRLLEEGASTFRFAHMQLGTSRRELPDRVLVGAKAGSLWRLEYPIGRRVEQEVHSLRIPDPAMLTIWCYLDEARPVGAERVAKILGPAIAAQLAEIPQEAWQPVVVRVSDLAGDAPAISPPVFVERSAEPRHHGKGSALPPA